MASPATSGTNVASFSLTAATLSTRALAVAGAAVAGLSLTAAVLSPGKLVTGGVMASVNLTAAALRPGLLVAGDALANLNLTAATPAATLNLGKVALVLTMPVGAAGTPSVGLTVWDAALDVYGLWRIEVKSPTALELARTRILAGINSVMQQIWSRADALNYFNWETLSLVVTSGTSEVALPPSVQSVIGPVSVTGGPNLSPINEFEGLSSYVDYWFGGQVPAIQPPAFYVNNAKDEKVESRTSIRITLPWPTIADYPLDVNIVRAVPRFTASDLLAQTPIQLPDLYVELIFLPLLREWASNDYLFTTETARPGIAAAAAEARKALGMLEPGVAALKNEEDATP